MGIELTAPYLLDVRFYPRATELVFHTYGNSSFPNANCGSHVTFYEMYYP